MLKNLILHDFFNFKMEYVPKMVTRLLEFYKKLKLRRFIYSLKKNSSPSVIKLIEYNDIKYKYNKVNDHLTCSNIRINFDRIDFLKIRTKISNLTKQNSKKLLKHLKSLKCFNLNQIFIPKVLEYELICFFNIIFGQTEILNKYISIQKPDKVILFNCNPNFISFFHDSNGIDKNIKIYKDRVYFYLLKVLNFLNLFFYVLKLIGSYFKHWIAGNLKKNRIKHQRIDNNVIFIINSKNQFNSVKPVFNYLKVHENLNPIYYFIQYFLPIKIVTNLLRFLWQIRVNNTEKIALNLKFDSVRLQNVLKIFYNSYLNLHLVQVFSFTNNIIKFFNGKIPFIVIISNDFNTAERIASSYFKHKNIPTFYIPHSAIPIINEMTTKKDILYYALGGESDKKLYIQSGIPVDNIKISGIPRYEKFYQHKTRSLEKIQDLFDGRIYEFKKEKISILLTTNPIGDRSNELIIKTVVNSLKELNLIDNLIIKLHPSEKGTLHKKVTKELNVNPIIIKDYNILEVISSCDLLLSQMSTTLLEAMIVGTPMILLEFINWRFDRPSTYEFFAEKDLIKANDQHSLTKEIQKLLFNKTEINKNVKNLKSIAEKFSYYNAEEPPTQKISRYLLELIKN